MNSSWGTEQTAFLVCSWVNGDSAGKIAGRLGGKSRNAVISKARRMGLTNARGVEKSDQRQGQTQFREGVLETFNSRCCITGVMQIEAVEAAHIVPYSISKDNSLENSLALRSDIHALFDAHLIVLFPSFEVRLDPKVEDEKYLIFDGLVVSIPEDLYRHKVASNLEVRMKEPTSE